MMDYETWKSIPNFPDYLVSDFGRVRSIKWGLDRILKLTVYKGYTRVGMFERGKFTTRRVHRLVMLAFVGAPPEGMEVRHLNGVPSDNRLENLKYGTRSENHADTVRHGNHPMAKKTHCKHGHPFDSLNTYLYITKNGERNRYCRTCSKTRNEKHLLKMKAITKGVA